MLVIPDLRDLRDAWREPITELLGPNHRVYAPFVATSLLLAAVAWRWSAPSGAAPRASLLRYLFPVGLFRHRSSRLDATWLVVRGPVQLLLGWPVRVSIIGVALAVCGQARGVFGNTPMPPLSERAPVFVAFSLVLFFADDLSRYVVHWLMHRVPALWELHKVHHSAEVLTPLTLYRVHPLESLLNQWRGAIVAGLVTGLFMWAFPGRLKVFEILGVDALGFVWTAVGANLRHSHVWLTFPPWLERWLISPAQHQLHHARDLPGVGNYGSALAIWDALFGTLLRSKGMRPPRVGLPRAEVNHAPNVLSLVVAPLIAALAVLARGARAPLRIRTSTSGDARSAHGGYRRPPRPRP